MLIPLIVFVTLLAAGIYLGELRWIAVVSCILLAFAGFFASSAIGWPLGGIAFLGVLDVVLILVIFKGDITIRR